jgi:hypothetical protein
MGDDDTERAAQIIHRERDALRDITSTPTVQSEDKEYVQLEESRATTTLDTKDTDVQQALVHSNTHAAERPEMPHVDVMHDQSSTVVNTTDHTAPTTNNPVIPSFGIADKIIRGTIILGMIGITVASFVTGVAAPLAIVSGVIDRAFDAKEILHILPRLNKFAESPVGKVLSATKNILLSSISRRIFKLTVPILALAGVGVATGGIMPVVMLVASAMNMVYNIAKDVISLRKTRSLEEKLKNINSINKTKETTELALKKLQGLGVDVSHVQLMPVQQDKASHLEDASPTSKTTTYMQSMVENVIEGGAALVEAFTEGSFFKQSVAVLAVTAGTSRDTNKRLSAAAERVQLTDDIIKAGGDPQRSKKDLVREKEATEKRMHALLELANNGTPTKEAVEKIEKDFQEAISAPHPKQSIGSRIWSATKQLFRDIATVHHPHVFHEPETCRVKVETAHKVEQESHDVLRNNLRAPQQNKVVIHDTVISPTTPDNTHHGNARQR